MDQSLEESWSREETIKARDAVELKTRVKIEVSDEVIKKIDALVTQNLGVASGNSDIEKEIKEIILHSDLFV